MKRLLLIALALICAVPAFAEGVWSRASEGYYHKDANCTFGMEYTWSESEPRAERSVADCASQTACPSCASDWLPRFTGDFPEWKHEIQPWACGASPETAFPYEIRRAWLDDPEAGTPDEDAIDWPSFYAGCFANASGGLTVMVVQPTEDRIQALRILMGGDFWVLSANYSRAELLDLQATVVDSLMTDGLYGVHGSGMDSVLNRVTISVDDDSEEIRAGIAAALREKGFSDGHMFLIRQEGRAQFG